MGHHDGGPTVGAGKRRESARLAIGVFWVVGGGAPLGIHKA